MQFLCIAKRVTVNDVNSNSLCHAGYPHSSVQTAKKQTGEKGCRGLPGTCPFSPRQPQPFIAPIISGTFSFVQQKLCNLTALLFTVILFAMHRNCILCSFALAARGILAHSARKHLAEQWHVNSNTSVSTMPREQ